LGLRGNAAREEGTDMLDIKMVGGDVYTGTIIYSNILQSYAPLKHCSDEFIVLRESSGKQRLLNRELIVSIYDNAQL
jgi:hypothetical protein